MWDGDISSVEECLYAGVPVDIIADEDGRTALMWAAINNRLDVVRVLLGKGADVNKRDRAGMTPLHWAARWNSSDTIAVLLEYGASTNFMDDQGNRPIDYAQLLNNEAALRKLEQL